MVRNAYGMAIPQKNRRPSLRINGEKMNMCLNRVENKDEEAAVIRISAIFKDKSIGDKLRSQNLFKKIILKGSAGQKQKKYFFWWM